MKSSTFYRLFALLAIIYGLFGPAFWQMFNLEMSHIDSILSFLASIIFSTKGDVEELKEKNNEL